MKNLKLFACLLQLSIYSCCPHKAFTHQVDTTVDVETYADQLDDYTYNESESIESTECDCSVDYFGEDDPILEVLNHDDLDR